MGLFGSGNKRVNTNDELQECISTQQDVGVYKWLPEYTWASITGASHYQPALKSLLKKYGTRAANVCLAREPENKFDSKAIAFYCDGQVIGHMEKMELDWWHKLFNFVGDENTKLVGMTTFTFWDNGGLVLAKPKIQVIRDIRKLVKQSQSPQQ